MRPRGLSLLTAFCILSVAGCAQPRREFRFELLCHPTFTYGVGTLYCHDIPDATWAGPSAVFVQHRTGDYPDLTVGGIRCPDTTGNYIPRVFVLNQNPTPAGPFDVVVNFTLDTTNSSGQPERIPIGFTGRMAGAPGNVRTPVDFLGLTIPVIQGDRLTVSVSVDPALVAPDWLLWGRVIETDETNNADSRQCDAVP